MSSAIGEQLPATRTLIGEVNARSGASLVEARAAALVELETLRSAIMAERDSISAVGGQGMEIDQRLEQELLKSKENLRTLTQRLADASSTIRSSTS